MSIRSLLVSPLVAHPTNVKNYTTQDHGDAHCRVLCIVLNMTFTAGGLSAPIFTVIYGLIQQEMPYNDIVKIPIKGLLVGPERNVYTSKEGYLVFVRGKYDMKDNEIDDREEENDENYDDEDYNANVNDNDNGNDITNQSKEAFVLPKCIKPKCTIYLFRISERHNMGI